MAPAILRNTSDPRSGIFLTANAGLTVLVVPLMVERLDLPGYTIGYVIPGLGAGFLVGPLSAPEPWPG